MRYAFIKIAALAAFCVSVAIPQVSTQTQRYRDDQQGNFMYRKQGIMDGNRIRTIFWNDGQVADWPNEPSGEWPNGSGHHYLDGVALLIAAKINVNGKPVHALQSAYREEFSRDPTTQVPWGLEPVPGYVKPSATTPAFNRDATTFPAAWPAALGLPPEWNGFWYGYFGRGVSNADFETFFVMDDSKNYKYQRADPQLNPQLNYYPITSDSSRGGIGLRVEVRGFQWSHVLAEDIIFWHYDIVNISDHDLDTSLFGFYTDIGVGGYKDQQPSNSAFFSRVNFLAYGWAPGGKGIPDNWKTGYVGYSYLESPGNPWDGIDNDFDGMIDERRDNNIDDNHNWIPYTDLNGNGKWDPGEPLNDDVGRDGVGPSDPGYFGPDEGEGDGKPTHGEPDFDETDKDESDQIGLTSVHIDLISDKGPSGVWPKNDERMWQVMSEGFADTTINNANTTLTFASGPFPLKKEKRERFSMALLFALDLDGLIFNKQTVQAIYNANYNFTKPPYIPTLTAVPGDQKVYLYWDSKAETFRDRFMGYEHDDPAQGYKKEFEGYLLYRSGEAKFEDVKTVTDSHGDGKYYKPLMQWDLVDSIKGPDPVGINGAHFWRGSDNGIQHSYIDTNKVRNGVRYYYALVSYSKGGLPKVGTLGIVPAECSKIIREDLAGNVTFTDINTAVVVPNAAAVGYLPPQIKGNTNRVASGIGSGSLELQVLNPSAIKDGAQYQVRFNATGVTPHYHTTSYDVIRTLGTSVDTVIANISAAQMGAGKFSPPFDGLVAAVTNDTSVSVIDTATGWIGGSRVNVLMLVSPDSTFPEKNVSWPANYEFRWYNTVVDTTAFADGPYINLGLPFTITNTTEGHRVKCIIYDRDGSGSLTFGDDIKILEGNLSDGTFKIPWSVGWRYPGSASLTLPTDGDRFVIKTRKPYGNGDYFSFQAVGSRTDAGLAQNSLGNIGVVPNPYVAAAKWERPTLFGSGRGERRIDFIHLPAKCTIRIFTVAGALVKTLTKDSPSTDGSLSWNLQTEDGMDAAYGLYIFHVDAPGIGEHIGKFALIK